MSHMHHMRVVPGPTGWLAPLDRMNMPWIQILHTGKKHSRALWKIFSGVISDKILAKNSWCFLDLHVSMIILSILVTSGIDWSAQDTLL